jgi:hypothetical protein
LHNRCCSSWILKPTMAIVGKLFVGHSLAAGSRRD